MPAAKNQPKGEKVPQATAPPQDDAAKRKAEKEAQEQEWRELIQSATTADGVFALGSEAVRDAIKLEAEMSAKRAEVNENRTLLRVLAKRGKLNDDQKEFSDTWFPEKEKGQHRNKQSIEDTRVLRTVALKDNGVAE